MKVSYNENNKPVYHVEDELDELIFDLLNFQSVNLSMKLNKKEDNYLEMEAKRVRAEELSNSIKQKLEKLRNP